MKKYILMGLLIAVSTLPCKAADEIIKKACITPTPSQKCPQPGKCTPLEKCIHLDSKTLTEHCQRNFGRAYVYIDQDFSANCPGGCEYRCKKGS